MTSASAARIDTSALADGEWHRLHPATPLLRGGIALVAIGGIIVANLRDRIFELLLHYEESDPLDLLIDRGWLIPALLIALAVIAVVVAGFFLAWRMHRFRVTDEIVEVRSGIVFRTHRKARLDRVQGVNIVRPFLPRLVGAARLQISVAGDASGVTLDYLSSSAADRLRRDVLTLASGARRESVADHEPSPQGSVLEQRMSELLAPELDPNEAEPESVVHLSLGRLIGSMALRDTTLIAAVVVAVGLPWIIVTDSWFALVAVVPGFIGLVSYTANRFLRSLRYSIAGTSNGIRIGFGLLSTTNETLPPGRIHAVEVSQPLLWRTTGWWEVKITRASQSRVQSAGSQSNTTVLPVGDRGDVRRVLGLLLPSVSNALLDEMVSDGMLGRGSSDDGYTTSPRSARVLRPFSWRRNGLRLADDLLFLRRGRIWRSVVALPLARMQSISVGQGPLYRSMGLAELHAQTVAGSISTRIGALAADAVQREFTAIARAAENAGGHDRSHRWGEATSAVGELS